MNGIVSNKIYDLLRKVVNENIENYSISVHDPNKKGEGFLSEMCYVSLQEKHSGNTLHFVVKQAFSDEKVRGVHPIRNYYLNEIRFYTKVWPYFQKFQMENSLSEPFDKIPKCFFTSSEYEHEKLLLENLKYQNFQMHEKRRPLDEEHVKFIFEQYGKFHAISFACKMLNPREYHEITKDLEDFFANLTKIESSRLFFKYVCELALKGLDPEKDAKTIEKFKPYIENVTKIFQERSNYSGDYSVVLHGDCWSNNMMFKYNESKQLCDMRLLDLQFSKIGTPVSDLSYCLYSGGSKEIFDRLDHYLRIYHNSLLKTLEEFGLKSKNIYPFENLKKDWKSYCQTGFLMGLIIWRAKLTYEESIIDFSDMKDSDESFMKEFEATPYDKEAFNIRSRDLLVHLAENDFL